MSRIPLLGAGGVPVVAAAALGLLGASFWTPYASLAGMALLGGSLAREVRRRKRLEAALLESQGLCAAGRVAAGVAHDFNNVLQSVAGSLETMLDEVRPDAEAHEVAAIALRAVRRGSYLARLLLSSARDQASGPEPVDLARFLPDVRALLERTLEPNVAVHLRVQRGTPQVLADPGQLQTALLNLAINAAQAMPGGGTLTIAARGEPEPGRAAVSVADTGEGMDAATLARAAEPFFTTKGARGTGLGLPMVKEFAERSGGGVRIVSAPGRGTTVELSLPAADPPMRPAESLASEGATA